MKKLFLLTLVFAMSLLHASDYKSEPKYAEKLKAERSRGLTITTYESSDRIVVQPHAANVPLDPVVVFGCVL